MRTKQAIKHFGNGMRLADALKIKPPAIYQWGEYPPLTRQYQIQVITKGKLKAEAV